MNEVAKQLGFEAEKGMRPAEVLKSNYVGNVSHFDIMKDVVTKEIILKAKDGALINTGLFIL